MMVIALKRGVGVAVGVGVDVGRLGRVGSGVGVSVGTGVGVSVGVAVGVGDGVAVGVGVLVAVGTSVGVKVAVGVGVDVGGLMNAAARCDCSFATGIITQIPPVMAIAATAHKTIGKYGNGCGSKFAPHTGHTCKWSGTVARQFLQ